MSDRRQFLFRTAAGVGAVAATPSLAAAHMVAERLEREMATAAWVDSEMAAAASAVSPAALAEDERFWARIRKAFTLAPDVVNLDHGWTNPAPRSAVDALVREARLLESLPAERLALIWEQVSNTTVRGALAEALGVPPAEIALVRNATEALDTVLLGVPLRAGDEIVCSSHDYFAMLDALDQRQRRDGVVLRMIRPPVPAPSLDALAALYEAAIGPRTRLVLLTHPSNLTGQLLPVRRIAAAAHAVGAEVVVDGAQSLGLLDNPVTSLDCDYYGASAHKWLGAPVGLGVLWMRPALVAKVWPLVPSPPQVTGMGRFEWIGTAPSYVEPAVLPALTLHGSLGPARKVARLRYLASYWRERVAPRLPNARFYTVADPAMSLGIGTVEIPGMDPKPLQQRLRQRDHVLVQAMANDEYGGRRRPEISGIRVSPNVFTTPGELDRFVAALARAASRP